MGREELKEFLNELSTALKHRQQLKGWLKEDPEKVLNTLKQVKSENYEKKIIVKSEISKTITRIAQYQYPNPSYSQAKITQLAQYLINKWREKVFNKKEMSFPEILYQKNKNNQEKPSGNEKSKKEEEHNNSSTLNQQPFNGVSISEVTREKGKQGLIKYITSENKELSQEKITQILQELENSIFSYSNPKEENEKVYKNCVKNICSFFLDASNSEKKKNFFNGELPFKKILKYSNV